MIECADWRGASGDLYRFELYPMGTEFHPNVGGVFLFVAPVPGNYGAVYVGETEEFNDRLFTRLTRHPRFESARRHGATMLGVHLVTAGVAERARIEADLRQKLNPPCNALDAIPKARAGVIA